LLGGRLWRNHAIGFQDVVHLARVYPVAVQDLRLDIEPLIDEVLDRIGDLQFAASGGLDPVHGLKYVPVEHVDADYGQV